MVDNDGLVLVHGDFTESGVDVTPDSFTGKTSDIIDYDGLALPNFMPTILDSDGLNEVIKKIDDKFGTVDSAITTGDAAQVSKSLFDANTILKADVDDTPLALTVPEDTLIGRKTGGDIDALIPADVLIALGITASIAELNYVDGVTSAIQTQITGNDTDITNLQAKFPVVTTDIQNLAVTNAKLANNAVNNAKLDSTLQTDITQITTNETNITTLTNLTTIAEQTIFGRRTGDGTAIGLTATQTLTLLGITVSATDINRLTGINDDVQVQIDNISDTFGNIDAFDEVTISGLTAPTSTDLTHIITAGIAFINNKRVPTSDTSHTYNASEDTYVDVDDAGTFTFPEVANGADAPSLTADSIRIMKVVTDVNNITGVTDLRPLDLRIDKLLGRKMDTPTGVTATLQAGGTLTADTELFYVVTATDGSGETIQSTEVSETPTVGNQTIKIDWNAVTKARFYRVYRRVSGIYKLYKEVTAPTVTLTDDGSAIFVTSGSPPLFTNAYRAKLEDIGDVTLEVGVTDILSGTAGRILFEGTGNYLQESDDLFWDNSSKYLAIGHTAPAAHLHIKGSGTQSIIAETTQTVGIARAIFQHSTGATDQVQIINSGTAVGGTSFGISNANLASIQKSGAGILAIGTVGTGALVFGTNDTEAMRINNSQQVGIGVDPQTNLHISEANIDTVPAVEIEQTSTGDAALQFSILGVAYAIGIDNSDLDKFKISYAAGAGTAELGTYDRFVIDSAGFIGIGHDTPTANLHLRGTGTQSIEVETTTQTTGLANVSLHTDGSNVNSVFLQLRGTTSSGTEFGINKTNLGILKKLGNGNFVIGTVGTGFVVLGANDTEVVRISSTPLMTVTGNATVSKHMGIGALGFLSNEIILRVKETITTGEDVYGINSSITLDSEDNTKKVVGARLDALMSGDTGGTDIIGVDIMATSNVQAGTSPNLIGATIQVVNDSGALVPPIARALEIKVPNFDGSKPTAYEGIFIENQGVAGITTSTALKIEDQTGSDTNNYAIITGLGNVGIGTSTPSAKLHIHQSSTTAADPVLYLTQTDVSEEMITFSTTIGVGNAIEAVGGKTLTTTHFIKVTIPGGLTRYIPVGTIA